MSAMHRISHVVFLDSGFHRLCDAFSTEYGFFACIASTSYWDLASPFGSIERIQLHMSP